VAQAFVAVLLVCLADIPREGCTEATATDVRSIVVEGELGCTIGWQELVARAPSEEQRASDAPVYLKTTCRRLKPGAAQR